MTTGLIAIHGRCSPAITLLRGTFVSSYAEDGAGGARIALIIGDETATDLWVGSSNPARTRARMQGTTVAIWASIKGILGTRLAEVVDRGLPWGEKNVCEYWSEFVSVGRR